MVVTDNYKQFSLEAALQAKNKAIKQVEENVEPDWYHDALQAVFDLCVLRTSFTTDEVWEILTRRKVEPPHEPRAMGAVMTRARGMKWIRASGSYVIGRRPEAHSRPIMIWNVRTNSPKWPSER